MQADAVDRHHLVGCGPQIEPAAAPDDHRGDHVARPGRVVVEQTQHRRLGQRDAHLFVQFAQRRVDGSSPGSTRPPGSAHWAGCDERRDALRHSRNAAPPETSTMRPSRPASASAGRRSSRRRAPDPPGPLRARSRPGPLRLRRAASSGRSRRGVRGRRVGRGPVPERVVVGDRHGSTIFDYILDVMSSRIEDVMPAAFIGHGNPMNALERNRFTTAWRAFGARVPRPRAILVVSARTGTSTPRPSPRCRGPGRFTTSTASREDLFDVRVPGARDAGAAPRRSPTSSTRPGSVPTSTAGASTTAPGRCSMHAFPDAAIPVVQLSINADRPLDYHLDLGRALAPLRNAGRPDPRQRQHRSQSRGHGLGPAGRRASTGRSGSTTPHGADAARDPTGFGRPSPTIPTSTPRCRRPTTSSRRCTSPGWRRAASRAADVLVDGYTYGSLSMTAYTLGASVPEPAGSASKYVCAMHIYVPHSRYDHLDELLTRLHVARQRPSWRRRLLDGGNPVANVSTLRVLRAVEQRNRPVQGPPSATSPSTWPSNIRPPAEP